MAKKKTRIPAKQTQRAKRAKPAQPAQPTKPTKSAKPAKSGMPAKRAKSGNPAKSAKPAKPAKSAKRRAVATPATPANPANPANRANPASNRLPLALAAADSPSMVAALQKKLTAIKKMADALRAKRTGTSTDDNELNPNIDSLRNEQRAVEAQLIAAQTEVLDPPTAADVADLDEAIRDAENTIARNAGVSELIAAATTLVNTLKG